MRHSDQLVPDILNLYRAHVDDAIDYGGLIGLWKNTKDDRIVDFLITPLARGFRMEDKSTDMSLSSLFVAKYKAGLAYYAAEELLAIGEERGISEIIPHFLEFCAHTREEFPHHELVDWCVRHNKTFNPYLSDGLNHKDKEIRNFAAFILKRTEDGEGK